MENGNPEQSGDADGHRSKTALNREQPLLKKNEVFPQVLIQSSSSTAITYQPYISFHVVRYEFFP